MSSPSPSLYEVPALAAGLALLLSGCLAPVPLPSSEPPAAARVAPVVEREPLPAIPALPSVFLDDPLIRDAFEVWKGDLDGMRERRRIRVLVSYSPTTFFIRKGTTQGFETAQLAEFQRFLNRGREPSRQLRLEFLPVPSFRLLEYLNAGHGDLAAAGLVVTPDRETEVAFSDPYLAGISEVIVAGSQVEVAGRDDLSGRRVAVLPGSNHAQSLLLWNEELRGRGLAPIEIVEVDSDLEAHDLLERVDAGVIDLTVCDLHVAELWARILPRIVVRPDLRVASERRIAWAVRRDSPELLASLNRFIAETGKGEARGDALFRRYHDNGAWPGNSDAGLPGDRLSSLEPLFRKYGDRYGIDWTVLAALAFQESRLDQSKRSRRGAVGVMQILPQTARDRNVGIPGIDQVESNIHAGTKYLAFLRERYFSGNLDPEERLYLSLAAYNMGPARLQGLRRMAGERGLDPDRWFSNVERVAAEEIGPEPVITISNIRRYYVTYKLSDERLRLRAEQRAAMRD